MIFRKNRSSLEELESTLSELTELIAKYVSSSSESSFSVDITMRSSRQQSGHSADDGIEGEPSHSCVL